LKKVEFLTHAKNKSSKTVSAVMKLMLVGVRFPVWIIISIVGTEIKPHWNKKNNICCLKFIFNSTDHLPYPHSFAPSFMEVAMPETT